MNVIRGITPRNDACSPLGRKKPRDWREVLNNIGLTLQQQQEVPMVAVMPDDEALSCH